MNHCKIYTKNNCNFNSNNTINHSWGLIQMNLWEIFHNKNNTLLNCKMEFNFREEQAILHLQWEDLLLKLLFTALLRFLNKPVNNFQTTILLSIIIKIHNKTEEQVQGFNQISCNNLIIIYVRKLKKDPKQEKK